MIISVWSPELHEEITNSWFNLQNETTGWIAREQILGPEARSRAPEWAWPGLITQMNPPVYFLTEWKYFMQESGTSKSFITKIFDKLVLTYNWYKQNLKSDVTNTFIWNGRQGDSSLDSGLDDFPRVYNRQPGEANVDIQSWMIASAKALSEIASAIGHPSAHILKIDYDIFLERLQALFWSDSLQFYTDIKNSSGIHTGHIGFPGMLPVCLGFETNATRIQYLIQKMSSDALLDKHGLLSLSRYDPKFRITGNYWRGNIWVNQQFLCCQGLKLYEKQFPEAKQLRESIEQGIISTMYRNYVSRTNGGIYETYHPFTGKGYNNVPFTGWSSLALLIMTQDY
jgi:mannosyl-oligosaccharide glucosidase